MFKTVGYVFLVLAIGSLAIAWSGRTVTHTPGHTRKYRSRGAVQRPTLACAARERHVVRFLAMNTRACRTASAGFGTPVPETGC